MSSPCSPYPPHCCAEQRSRSGSAVAFLNGKRKALFMARNNNRFQWHAVSCAYLCRLVDYSLLLDEEPKQGGAWAAHVKKKVF